VTTAVPPPGWRWLRSLAAAAGLGAVSGVLIYMFLVGLRWVTTTREEHRWLLWLLPVAGLVMGAAISRAAGLSLGGTRRTMTEIRKPLAGVPFRMAPISLLGTLTTHLFGGSAGREGTALQITGGVAGGLGARLGWSVREQRQLLVVSLAAGFGAVFGVPWAGIVFAFEVAPTGAISRVRALLASAVAVVIAHGIVERLGYRHTDYGHAPVDLSGGAWWRLWFIAIALGIGAWVFPRLVDLVDRGLHRVHRHRGVRMALGGGLVALVVVVFNAWDETGLSLGVLSRAVDGDASWRSFVLKLVLTAITLGAGFPGGEVTPSFVMGATLSVTVADWIGSTHATVAVAARLGFVALFGAAANAPLAATVMGVEMFGWSMAPVLLVGCVTARIVSGSHHIYECLDEDDDVIGPGPDDPFDDAVTGPR